MLVNGVMVEKFGGNNKMTDYNMLYNFFKFKGRKPFEYAERIIDGKEFEKFADAAPNSDTSFNKFVEDTDSYKEFIVYNDIGVMSGRAGIKTPDNKFNITIIRS
jgi:hypothetical protein